MIAAIIAAISVVALIGAYLLAPKPSLPSSNANSLDDFNVTTNSNSRVIPEVFGTVEIKGNVIWYGDLRSKEITKYVGGLL